MATKTDVREMTVRELCDLAEAVRAAPVGSGKLRRAADVRNAVLQAGLDRFIYIDELKNPPAAGTVYLTPDDRPPVG
jgi:hypothetical protein